MSAPLVFAWPEWLGPASFELAHDPHDVYHEGMYGRTSQVEELDVDRWHASLQIVPQDRYEAAAAEAYIGLLRGRRNLIAMGDLRKERAVPRGTLRGNPTLSAAHVQGAQVLSVATGQPGATLLAGDRLGLVAQLLEVAFDCVADATGLLSVPITQRLWAGYAEGTTVIWNRPVTRWRRTGTQPSIRTLPGHMDGWSIELVQHIDPSVIVAIVPSAPRGRADGSAVVAPLQSGVQLNIGNAAVGV